MDAAQERINERVAAGPTPEPSLTIRGAEQVRAALVALNAHADLVHHLGDLIDRLEVCSRFGGNDKEIVDIMLAPARAALAKAQS